MKRKALVTALATLSLISFSAPPVMAGDKPVEPGAVGRLINDSALTGRVKAALAADDLTDALDINVETTRGVVELKGTVDSYAQMTQAARVAYSVEGVNGVENRLEVSDSAATNSAGAVKRYLTDAAITAKVKAALAADSTTEATEIEVETTRGIVTLSGVVDGFDERDQATALALSIDGVRSVSNKLDLASTDGTRDPGAIGRYINDAALTARVKTALAVNTITEAAEIKVETTRGVVRLQGLVDNREEVDEALRVARSVDGVEGVENALRIVN